MMKAFSALALLAMTSALFPVLAAAKDEPKDTPPAGIAATTTTLHELLTKNDAASGTLAPGAKSAASKDVWSMTVSGVSGTETLIRRGTDYHSTIVLGPLTQEFGQLAERRWEVNENGVPSPSKSDDYMSFMMFRVMDDVADPKNDVTLLGEVSSPSPAYVVQVKVSHHKHLQWLFFDKQTYLVTRTERAEDHGERLVTTYDDYRKTRGLTEPWHVHDTLGDAATEDDYKRVSTAVLPSASDKEFQRPADRATFARITGPLDLHAHFIDDTPFVRVNVGGRGLDFEVSTGDGYSIIDSDVARELNLPTFGHPRSDGKGKPLVYETSLGDATIGDALRIKDFALTAMPFHYHLNQSVKIVGILGYDFLTRGTFKFDYVNKSLTVEPVADYDKKIVDDAYMLPVTFDSGLAYFKGTIAEHESESLLFDNSFDFSFVFGGFTAKYPDAVADTEGKKHAQATIPFADNNGYGRDVDLWMANLPDVFFGPAHFKNYHILATNEDMEFGGHSVDAVMGADLLSFYDVYTDYGHSRIFLKPNRWFFKMFKAVP